jgi:hypothetical protein
LVTARRLTRSVYTARATNPPSDAQRLHGKISS